ncbi:MAG: ABC transporter substrate-binding protein [Phycisphaeraceae bacterium]|nr:MAG: ABC transporter substrate-binding protein [Phycisphaeraceae bacterium]
MRVVSLAPSATDIVARIGGIGRLVGRSHACDGPPQVLDRPVLTAPCTSYDPPGPGWTLDARRLAELRPDVVLTGGPEGPGSIDPGSLRDAVAGMQGGRRAEIVALSPDTIEGVLDDHLTVGRAIGLEEEASGAVFELRGRWLAAESYVNPYTEGPVVGFLECTDPLAIAGLWTVQMIERAGGRHPLNETVARPCAGAAAGMQAGQRVAGPSIGVPAEVFAASRPERLIIAPRGLSLDQAVAQAERLRASAWWNALPAAQSGRVAVVDGRVFSRPGPGLVDAFAWLVGWINERPELVPVGFPWVPLDLP